MKNEKTKSPCHSSYKGSLKKYNLWVAAAHLLVLCLALITTGCHGQGSPSLRTATPTKYQRDFPVLENTFDGDLSTQLAEQLEIVIVSNVPSSGLGDAVANPDQTLQAFTVCEEQCGIFVEERGAGQFYELRGPFLSWRPFSGVSWLNNDILAFDQWANPHYGVHYEINFRERKLVLAMAITDVVEP